MSKQGYIKLHRQIQDCWIWIDENEPERFTRGQAWIDLLLFANHREKKIRYNDGFKIIKRGQFLTSKRKLAERWMWNRRTVDRFFDLLVKDEMVSVEYTTKHTLVTIINYDNYQSSEVESAPQSAPQSTPQDTPQSTPRSSTNKNDKNVKNEKNVKNVFKKPSLEEVKAYIEEKGYSIDAERFINYYESNGWMVGRNKMKNWKAAVSNWASKDKPKTNTSYDDAVKAFLESED